MIIKLLASIAVGIILGTEREIHKNTVGIKTILLISIGTTIFSIMSLTNTGDPHRLAAQVLTGIGFLGGGAILKTSTRVHGTTTASVIWLTAALGLMCGFGYGLEAILIAIGCVIILNILRKLTARRGKKQ